MVTKTDTREGEIHETVTGTEEIEREDIVIETGVLTEKTDLMMMLVKCHIFKLDSFQFKCVLRYLYPRSPKGEGGILFYLCSSVCPSSVQDIFRRIFLSNC